MRLLLTDCFLYTPEEYGPGEVLVVNGRIAEVARRVETRQGAEVVGLEGAILAPGLIDLHVHGGNGVDTMDGEAGAIAGLSAFVAAHGVTGFLPTTVTAPLPEIERALKAVRRAVDGELPGAQVLGVHLEGPFFNRRRAGAQPLNWCVDPARDALQRLLATGEGLIRMMSLAPELPGALAAIETLTQHGIVASVGHTDATYAQAQAAFAAGARHVTHLFNAMSPLHHRERGDARALPLHAGGGGARVRALPPSAVRAAGRGVAPEPRQPHRSGLRQGELLRPAVPGRGASAGGDRAHLTRCQSWRKRSMPTSVRGC